VGRFLSCRGGSQRPARSKRAGHDRLYPVRASREGGLCPTSLEVPNQGRGGKSSWPRSGRTFRRLTARVRRSRGP
jgi:hypothetical protein